jgi:ribosomal protein S11
MSTSTIQQNKSNLILNKFFNVIILKKQYIKKLKYKLFDLTTLKKNKNSSLYFNQNFLIKSLNVDNLIKFIITITFTKSNTYIHISDYLGKLKYFFSAGFLTFKGKKKKDRRIVLKSVLKKFRTSLKFLQSQPIALHLKNVGLNKFWIIKNFKQMFFIKLIKNFNLYAFNGCRKKKIRRKR